ncbi:MAG: DUF4838 domain-containing protein, partial [bacterium]|nr:DUF4838 domain-containing protein [bacterium]
MLDSRVLVTFIALLVASGAASAQTATPVSEATLDEAVAPHPEWRNALAPKGTPGPELTLAKGGQPAYTILLPASPTTVEEKAAADLGMWLTKIAGGPFAVANEGAAAPATPVISVGRTRRLANAGIEAASTDLAREGYGIAVKGQDLFLWGGDTRGAVNAVYAFLEEDLGCRWYQRGTATIPQLPDLVVAPVPRTFTPVLEVRDPFYWDAFEGEWSLRNRTNAPSAEVPDEWGGHIRYAGGFFVHTYWRLVPAKEYFDEHPEYFSEIGGKRVTSQLCVTNPAVIQLAIERTLEALRADPTAPLISISPNDGTGYCECERCAALDGAEGSKAASLLQLVNAVADAIKDEFPLVKVSTLAYLDTVQPPKTIRPRDNVVIRLCTDRHAWAHDFEFQTETQEFQTALKAWSAIDAKIHVWDYTVNFSHYMIPMPNMPVVTQNVRFMVDHNVQGMMLQGAYQSPGAARGPLRCWVWGKQLWDPDLNTRDLIRDFAYGFYGSAAEPMQAYNELLWRTWELEHMGALREAGNIRYPPTARFLSNAFLTEALELFAQAEALADTPETLRRVELAKLSILYTMVARGPEGATGDYGALVDEFDRIARREKVTHLWEGGADKTQLDEKVPYWKGLAGAEKTKVSALPVGELWQFQPDPDE